MNCASSCRFGLLVLAGLILAPRTLFAQPQERPPLPDYLKVSVVDAIERGKRYLMRSQQQAGPRLGSWAEGDAHKVGYTALPALTLLECGVPANSPHIVAAANFVRGSMANLDSTYEVSLALLFLDRLGNPKDKMYIEALAARLIGGQTHTGGWSYKVPLLNEKDSKTILNIVKNIDPLPLQDLVAGRIAEMRNPFEKREVKLTLDTTPKKAKVKIPPELAGLPCLTNFGTFKLFDPDKKAEAPIFGTTCNSNTQFALLALWAARRHGIPMSRTGSLAFMRFHTSQNSDGGWDYRYTNGGGGGTPTMISVGLLGLAIGHGVVREMKIEVEPSVDLDKRVMHAFQALGRQIGEPQDKIKDLPMPNLYMLWSTERIGVLYGMELIGAKDWYRWGAEALVANQEDDGHWYKKDVYPGASPTIDSCFALLFLKRANLAKDLSAYLAFSPKKLNEGVLKLSGTVLEAKTEPPPPETKPEPPKVETNNEPPKVDTKPEEKPVQVAENKPREPMMAQPSPMPTPPAAAPAPEQGNGLVIWLIVGAGGLLIVGGLLFFFLTRGGSGEDEDEDDQDEEDEEEEERPRKKKKSKRR